MFFTGDYALAKSWGQEHYSDFEIIYTFLPLKKIKEFKSVKGRDTGYLVHDFEVLENTADFEGDIIHYEDASDGYIVKNVDKYELYYM